MKFKVGDKVSYNPDPSTPFEVKDAVVSYLIEGPNGVRRWVFEDSLDTYRDKRACIKIYEADGALFQLYESLDLPTAQNIVNDLTSQRRSFSVEYK